MLLALCDMPGKRYKELMFWRHIANDRDCIVIAFGQLPQIQALAVLPRLPDDPHSVEAVEIIMHLRWNRTRLRKQTASIAEYCAPEIRRVVEQWLAEPGVSRA